MNTLVNLFATGRIVIYILALLVVEGVVLIVAARVAGKSIRPLDLIMACSPVPVCCWPCAAH